MIIPKDANVSPEASDLIRYIITLYRKLVCDPRDRLGVNGVE